MKRVLLTAGLVVSLVGMTAASVGPTKVVRMTSGNSKTAQGRAQIVDDMIGPALDSAFSCMEQTSAKDLANVLEWNRQRELLGNAISAEDWANLAGAIGANYVISTNVTITGGGTVISISVMGADGTTVAKIMKPLGPDDDAVDAFDDAVQDLIDQLRDSDQFSEEKCPPPNEWIGTITYTVARNFANEARWDISGIADEGTPVHLVKASGGISVTINITRERMTAEVSVQESVIDQKEIDGRVRCRAPGNWTEAIWKSVHYSLTETTTHEAKGTTNGGADLSVSKGKIGIHLRVPAVPGKVTLDRKETFGGGCGPRKTEDGHSDLKWEGSEISEDIAVPWGSPGADTSAGAVTPRAHAGFWTAPANELNPGLTKTIKWSLRRGTMRASGG